jgi:hypothetical protein
MLPSGPFLLWQREMAAARKTAHNREESHATTRFRAVCLGTGLRLAALARRSEDRSALFTASSVEKATTTSGDSLTRFVPV